MNHVYRLPWPPSVNHYYRHTARGVFIGKAGKTYRKNVCMLRRPPRPLEGRLGVRADMHPPGAGRFDLDNLGKALLDAMQRAGFYANDEQIDDLRFVRRDPAEFAPGVEGLVVVTLWVIGEDA